MFRYFRILSKVNETLSILKPTSGDEVITLENTISILATAVTGGRGGNKGVTVELDTESPRFSPNNNQHLKINY